MDGKVVLITGGSSGIGRETALQLMQKNMRVYCASRRLIASEKSGNGKGEIIPVLMDVNDEENIQVVVDHILSENDRIDAVICNAGNGIAGAVEDTSIEEARYQMETNFFGVVKTIKILLPIFRKQRYGKIIAVSSVGAVTPLPYQSFYSASKAAISIFMQSLSIEVKPLGIQCCTILPGNVKTGFTSSRIFTKNSYSENSAYSNTMKISISNMVNDENNGMKASFIAKKITKQITKKRMKEINIPGIQYKFVYWLFNISPVRFRQWLVTRLY